MLPIEQLKRAEELFTAACNANAALHAAFVSTDDLVSVDLNYNGTTNRYSIPTYHYLLAQVEKLGRQVSQMQVSDDGSDVVQLLSQTGKLTMLYLQKRQAYVAPPKNAELLAYDYETIPTEFSSADRTVAVFDMTGCALPPDAQYIIAKVDNGPIMRLPLQFQTTAYDKVATVLSVEGTGAEAIYLLDSNDLQVGMQVQCNSTVYTVTNVSGQSVMLDCDQPVALKNIQPGDEIHTVTDAAVTLLEVPISSIASKVSLQVQYMQLLSAAAEYEFNDMENAIHQSLRTPLKYVLRGISRSDIQSTLGNAMRQMPSNIADIIANSTPVITKTTVRQTNTHQYIHSALETMQKTNAILTQAKEDIQRLEKQIQQTTVEVVAAGGDTATNQTLLTYTEQLASTKNRYDAAQASLSSMNVSAQHANPTYVATIYCEPTDSNELPVVQYIARYQYLSLEVKDVKNDWHYAYSNKRYIDADGKLTHDIDTYDILNSIELPIHAYEQVVVQVAAVLQYGQPFLTVQTGWTDQMFLTIPEALLKEVSIDEMFKNAYEAKLYTNIQQAMDAAGVFKHINTAVTYAHRAQDIQYDNEDTIYTKLQQLIRDVASIQSEVGNTSLLVYVQYGDTLYDVTNGASIDIQVPQSFYNAEFAGLSGNDLQEKLGVIHEEHFNILIVNKGNQAIQLHTLIPGMSVNTLQKGGAYDNYADIPIVLKDGSIAVPTEAMAAYRGKYNQTGNRQIVKFDDLLSDASADNNNGKHWFRYRKNGKDVPINIVMQSDLAAAFPAIDANRNPTTIPNDYTGQDAAFVLIDNNGIVTTAKCCKIIQDYPGIGVHVGMPKGYIYKDASNQSEEIKSFPNDISNILQGTNLYKIAYKAALEFPKVDTKNWSVSDWTKPGSGVLAEDYVQPGLINIDGRDGQYIGVTRFDTTYHKYLSGRASRGAFMYLNPDTLSALQLPIYGTSNATPIQPGQGIENAFVIRGTFQTRMCDRLGITDRSASISRNPETQTLQPATGGGNFSYCKSINVHIKTGMLEISFDINMKQSWL